MGRKLFGSRPRPKKIQNLDTSIEYTEMDNIVRKYERFRKRKKEIHINILRNISFFKKLIANMNNS